jgi:hypothetical protein
MRVPALLFAFFPITIGVVGPVSPDSLENARADVMHVARVLYLTGSIRLAMGLVLILFAQRSRMPKMLRILGVNNGPARNRAAVHRSRARTSHPRTTGEHGSRGQTPGGADSRGDRRFHRVYGYASPRQASGSDMNPTRRIIDAPCSPGLHSFSALRPSVFPSGSAFIDPIPEASSRATVWSVWESP